MIRPVFVASIGNPPPAYANTLHSAGHTLLYALRKMLSYPFLVKSRVHGNGSISRGSEFTLWQSPTLMNATGPTLKMAWMAFQRSLPTNAERSAARLVVLHDELENPIGRIKVRQGGSERGHNGLKSIREHIGGDFTRVGICIGRCESREPNDVARYVMRRMKEPEVEMFHDKAGEVLAVLNEIRNNS